ncbi:MAG: glycogen/starch synthase [Candidatus Aenigmarchaeota archaeon]|nr:glycogen/starch synthase [Candidatus Aenigmarchaeota archaeon]
MSLIFEVSFECGNKVGGIWKVITSKSKEMKKRFGNEYFTVGFFNPKNYVNEFSDKNPPAWLKKIFDELRKEKIICYYGEWTEANDVQLILVDSKEFENDNVNDIKKELWEKYKIDSLNTGNDFNTPIAWSYAVGKLLEKISRKKDVVAHFHEWLSGAGLLYLKMNNVPVPTVFTTHATSFGRAKTLFLPKEEVKERVPLEEVYKYGVAAKHLTEVACANNADVFTTVSEVMKNEVIYVLGKKPDIITVNALDFSNIPSIDEIQQLNYKLRKKADEFIRAYFSPYYPIDLKNYPIIFTSGRYEFFNKGFDLFIDSIGELNKRLKGTKNLVVVFIFVPTGIIGPKDEVVDNIMTYRRIGEILEEEWEKIKNKIISELPLIDAIEASDIVPKKPLEEIRKNIERARRRRGLTPPLSAFELAYKEDDDMIIKRLKENGLLNRESDRVKVIFYPLYLSKMDALLGMDYTEAVIASSVGVFLSRYEPFGYTPLETAAYATISITSDYSGFGRFILKSTKNPMGLFVVDAVEKSNEEIVKQTADILEKITKMDKEKRIEMEISARKMAEKCSWDKNINNYIKAYNLATKRLKKSISPTS